jgi:hypothetical protein
MCFNKLFLPEAKQKVSLGKEPSKEQARRLHQRGRDRILLHASEDFVKQTTNM